MRFFIAIFFFLLSVASHAACTNFVLIKDLLPRSGGWIHIVGEGQSNMDISSCGTHNHVGLLLNFNDTSGTEVGKKAMFSILLSAHASGKSVKLCSSGCDSQYPLYSRLDYIEGIK